MSVVSGKMDIALKKGRRGGGTNSPKMTVLESQESGCLGHTAVLVLCQSLWSGWGDTHLLLSQPRLVCCREKRNLHSMLTTVQCTSVHSGCSINKCPTCISKCYFFYLKLFSFKINVVNYQDTRGKGDEPQKHAEQEKPETNQRKIM